MYLLQSFYPYALASVNVAIGWLLYQSLESALGLVLLTTGVLVLTTVLTSTVARLAADARST